MYQFVRSPERRSPHVHTWFVPWFRILAPAYITPFFPRSRGIFAALPIRLEWINPTPRNAFSKAIHTPPYARRRIHCCNGTQRALAPVRVDGVSCAGALLVGRSVGVCRCAESDFSAVQGEGEGGGTGCRAAEGICESG